MCKCETGDILVSKLKMQNIHHSTQRSAFKCLLHISEKEFAYSAIKKKTEIAEYFGFFQILIIEFTFYLHFSVPILTLIIWLFFSSL